MANVKWEGVDDIQRNMDVYASKVHQAVRSVGAYFAPIVESYAKETGKWTDRSGNLRQGIHGYVEDVSERVVLLVLQHKMDYGVYVETVSQGKYATLLPALEQHYNAIMDMLREIFR